MHIYIYIMYTYIYIYIYMGREVVRRWETQLGVWQWAFLTLKPQTRKPGSQVKGELLKSLAA